MVGAAVVVVAVEVVEVDGGSVDPGSVASDSVESPEQPVKMNAMTSTTTSEAVLERIVAPFPPISTINDTDRHSAASRFLGGLRPAHIGTYGRAWPRRSWTAIPFMRLHVRPRPL